MAAATALGELGDSGAVGPLIHLLRDRSAMLRGAAAHALGKLGDRTAVEPLIARLRDRGTGRKDISVGPCLFGMTAPSSSGWVRWNAIRALAELGDPRAIGPLEDLLSSRSYIEEADETIGEAARTAICRIKLSQ